MKEKTGAMVLGIGALLGGLLLLFRKGKPALAEAPPNGVLVALWDPPSDGNYWQLLVFNEVWGASIVAGTDIPVSEAITLTNIPAEWRAPLYIDLLIYQSLIAPRNIVYQVQSAYGPDWPDYKEVFIPDYGSYYYNVAKERFEKA